MCIDPMSQTSRWSATRSGSIAKTALFPIRGAGPEDRAPKNQSSAFPHQALCSLTAQRQKLGSCLHGPASTPARRTRRAGDLLAQQEPRDRACGRAEQRRCSCRRDQLAFERHPSSRRHGSRRRRAREDQLHALAHAGINLVALRVGIVQSLTTLGPASVPSELRVSKISGASRRISA